MQLSQKQKIFPEFFFRFVNLDTNLNISKKNDDPHSWCIFDFTDSETRGSVNIKNVLFQRTLPQIT